MLRKRPSSVLAVRASDGPAASGAAIGPGVGPVAGARRARTHERWRHRAAWLAVCAAFALPAAAQTPTPYSAIEWVAPRPGQTIHDNSGNVPVELAIEPPLRAADGDRLGVAVDGRPLPQRWATPSFVVPGIDRGEHQLQAFVVAADGRRLAASEPLTFYLWQASRLFPQRRTQ